MTLMTQIFADKTQYLISVYLQNQRHLRAISLCAAALTSQETAIQG
jgi:hypothetical protein